jgi:hypothetical protein
MFLGILQKKGRVWSNFVHWLSLCDVLLCSALSFPNVKAHTPAISQLVLSPSTISQRSRPTALDATSICPSHQHFLSWGWNVSINHGKDWVWGQGAWKNSMMFEGTKFLFRPLMACTPAVWIRVVKRGSTTLSSACGNTIRPSDRVCTTHSLQYNNCVNLASMWLTAKQSLATMGNFTLQNARL